MQRFLTIVSLITIALSGCTSQKALDQNFKDHITYLASDELKGREAGTPEEKEAANYIAEQFKSIGLSPAGTDGFYQDFEFLMGKDPGDMNVVIDETELEFDESYFPLNFSGNATVSGELLDAGFGIEAADLGYSDYTLAGDPSGKIVVFSVSSPDGIHPHSKYLAYHGLRNRVKTAEEKGASGVILMNEDPTAADPTKRYTEKMATVGIPVIFVMDPTLVKGKTTASLKIELTEDNRIARNVVGKIDNGATYNVIIGAHFDHLGYGEHGGSLYRGEEKQIHNGADDNASGTAMLIEIARTIKQNGPSHLNYLFISFTGEEKGLLGANYFTKNPTISLENASYMINMDMVGRLDTADYDMAINGVGTSPTWDSLITSINMPLLDINTTESGVGPSDQTSFYLSDIPVLHFFTGTHENYHKPSDDAEFINYEGMVIVYDYIMQVINALNADEKLAFSKTQDSNSRSAPRFTVTLGIVPDYMYEKGGVKVDGVSDGKPASVAGIQKGDLVMKLGEHDIDDMYAYMDALSMFKKGDKAVAVIKRGEETLEVEIQF